MKNSLQPAACGLQRDRFPYEIGRFSEGKTLLSLLLSPRRTIVCVADGPRFTLQQLASDHQTRRQDGKEKEGRKEILGSEVFPQVIVPRQKVGTERRSEEPPEILWQEAHAERRLHEANAAE